MNWRVNLLEIGRTSVIYLHISAICLLINVVEMFLQHIFTKFHENIMIISYCLDGFMLCCLN
jgi:hypothetical protein